MRFSQNHLLSYSKWFYTGCLALIMISSNDYKVNIHIFYSVNVNGLKHSLLNVSIYQIYEGGSKLKKLFI
jgi:hypothetical protein